MLGGAREWGGYANRWLGEGAGVGRGEGVGGDMRTGGWARVRGLRVRWGRRMARHCVNTSAQVSELRRAILVRKEQLSVNVNATNLLCRLE